MRSLRLVFVFLRNALQIEMEYRSNLLANMANSVLTALLSWLMLPAFFATTHRIGGWDLDQMIALFGVTMILGGVIGCWLFPSLNAVSEYVRRGDLDLLLIRPVDSQFFVSFRCLRIWHMPNMALGFAAVLYAMAAQGALGPGNVLLFLMLMLSGTAILYVLYLSAATLCFWFTQVNETWIIPFTIQQIGRFPVSAFPGWLRVVFTFVVPIAFMTNVPAEAASGAMTWSHALSGLAAAAVALVLGRFFWRIGLARYSSASS